ncbi:potassium transporter KefB [Adhaeribacter sp. BT258]|uniref:Potassium transporter KefB n=1 Tax=Adhaeribacter terrigena TaxID=2793070 RepID=A0ABS1BZH8_9BACT|nr:potassium transporter KefB [Adhaeribacter terrigena]MBK0402541.1 potassium transporter KefB [Adhaeribacter terrigena]
MSQQKNVTTPQHGASLGNCLSIGAGIALLLILFFLISGGWFTQQPKPEWEKYWMIRPLIVVPIAGAAGGALFYFLGFLRNQGGWITALAYFLSTVGYIIILWLGTVFGLAGTWWN